MSAEAVDRRRFLGQAAGIGAAVAVAGVAHGAEVPDAVGDAKKRIRVGVIGCGSVSGRYLPHLSECPFVEVVSVCDIIPERAVNGCTIASTAQTVVVWCSNSEGHLFLLFMLWI